MRLDPSMLQSGYVSLAKNCRFRNGIAETRRGSIIPPWMNNISGGSVLPWGTVYGIGLFSDPVTLNDYSLIAANGNVYYTTENATPAAITLPAGVTITSNVTFVQAFDTVVMFRGLDDEPLAMTSIAAGFTAISPTSTTITRTGSTATVTTPLELSLIHI